MEQRNVRWRPSRGSPPPTCCSWTCPGSWGTGEGRAEEDGVDWCGFRSGEDEVGTQQRIHLRTLAHQSRDAVAHTRSLPHTPHTPHLNICVQRGRSHTGTQAPPTQICTNSSRPHARAYARTHARTRACAPTHSGMQTHRGQRDGSGLVDDQQLRLRQLGVVLRLDVLHGLAVVAVHVDAHNGTPKRRVG
eukprot:361041-Chlamydomonas_euryale.AAC.1